MIALAVLFLFLRQWRAVAVVGVAVPVSLLGALALLYLMGLSLNLFTLGGLWLSVGLLIDNSIVVYEAVLRRLERGIDPGRAARIGLQRTLRAIVAATATTAIVMLPAGIMDLPVDMRSVLGEFIPAFLLPLGASMLVAVGLVPVLTHRLAAPAALRAVARQREARAKAGGQRAPDPLRILFGGLVGNAMRRPSAWLTGTGIAIVATVLFAVPVAISNQSSADPEYADSVSFSAEALKGAGSLEAVADAVAKLERAAMAIDGVETVTSDISQEGAMMRVDLVDRDERPPDLTVSRIRRVVAEAAEQARAIDVSRPGEERGGRGRTKEPGGGSQQFLGGGADEILVSGPESRVLERLADDLVMRLEAVDQVGLAWQSVPRGREEIWVEPDRRGFEAFELTVDEVLPGLRFAGLGGMNAGPYVLSSGREIPVFVERVGGREPDGLKDLRRLRVHTDSGVTTVSALASIRQMPPPQAIVHRNGRRETSVFYRLDASAPESGSARDALDDKIAAAIRSAPRPHGYAVEIQEENETLATGAEYALWAGLLVLLVLAVTFESLTLPWAGSADVRVAGQHRFYVADGCDGYAHGADRDRGLVRAGGTGDQPRDPPCRPHAASGQERLVDGRGGSRIGARTHAPHPDDGRHDHRRALSPGALHRSGERDLAALRHGDHRRLDDGDLVEPLGGAGLLPVPPAARPALRPGRTVARRGPFDCHDRFDGVALQNRDGGIPVLAVRRILADPRSLSHRHRIGVSPPRTGRTRDRRRAAAARCAQSEEDLRDARTDPPGDPRATGLRGPAPPRRCCCHPRGIRLARCDGTVRAVSDPRRGAAPPVLPSAGQRLEADSVALGCGVPRPVGHGNPTRSPKRRGRREARLAGGGVPRAPALGRARGFRRLDDRHARGWRAGNPKSFYCCRSSWGS